VESSGCFSNYTKCFIHKIKDAQALINHHLERKEADKCAWTFGHYQFQTPNGAWANMTFGGRNWLIQRNLWKTGSQFYCMVDSTHN